MGTVLYKSPIFGPVHSRRLGVSLGVNLMPEDRKICSFDCIYCECGRNAETKGGGSIPTRSEVREALEQSLVAMKQSHSEPNVITFAGNGEPTLHPDFAEIVEDVIELRDNYFPAAKVSVLSNATQIVKDSVFNALKRVDNNIQKLDTVTPDYINLVDAPVAQYNLPKIVERLKMFDGDVIIQTIFLSGEYNGIDVDNTTSRYLLPWLKSIQEIRPKSVMVYTIDRETPVKSLRKVSKGRLDEIVAMIKALGIDATASY